MKIPEIKYGSYKGIRLDRATAERICGKHGVDAWLMDRPPHAGFGMSYKILAEIRIIAGEHGLELTAKRLYDDGHILADALARGEVVTAAIEVDKDGVAVRIRECFLVPLTPAASQRQAMPAPMRAGES